MIPRRLALHRIALKTGIYTSFTLAFSLAFLVRFRSGLIFVESPPQITEYLVLYLVALVAWGALIRVIRLDHLWVASDPEQWIRSGVWATAGTLMAVFFATFFFRAYSFSRLFVVLLGGLNLVALGVTLKVLLALAKRGARHGDEIKVLVVGDGLRANEIAGIIVRNSWVPCKVLGYLSLDEARDGSAVRF